MSQASTTLQDLQADRLVIPLKSPCGGPKGSLLLSQLKRSSAQSSAQKDADQFGPGRTLAGTPESTSTPEPSLGETAHPSGPDRTLPGTPEPTSTLEAALGETPHPGQQNSSERLANLPSESHLLGSIMFGDNNTNCGNTTDSYNTTINNHAQNILGGGMNNHLSGFTINQGPASDPQTPQT